MITTNRKYGGAFASKADSARDTQQLIAKVSHTIKSIKPGVEFGVSPGRPGGVTDHTDPLGSDTRGAAAYDESDADTRLMGGTRIAGLHCSPNLLAVLTECRAL